MPQKILVPLDGSERAEFALEQACTLLQQPDDRLYLLRVPVQNDFVIVDPAGRGWVIPERPLHHIYEEAKGYLEEVKARFAQEDYWVQTLVESGDEASVIVDVAAAQETNLIIMSTHGRTGFSRWFMGSVTEKVLYSSPGPVLITHSPEPIRKILIPLDGSILAQSALRSALEIASRLQAQVTLLMVEPGSHYDTPLLGELEYAHATGRAPLIPENLTPWPEDGRAYLNELVQAPWWPHIATKAKVEIGPVADTILAYAEANHIDLIAMATHGYTGLRRWVYGSVMQKVMRKTDKNMLIVRPQSARLR